MPRAKVEAYFFVTVFVGILLLVGYLFLPYLGALAVALVLATLVHPLYARILVALKHEVVSALVTVGVAAILILAPATLLVYFIGSEVRSASDAITAQGPSGLHSTLAPLEAWLNRTLPFSVTLDARSLMGEVVGWASRNVGDAFTSTASVMLKAFVSLIALYYFLKDGERYKAMIIRYSPLPAVEDTEIMSKLGLVTHSLIRGRLLIALLQGLLTAIGFVIFGVPNPVLWGSVAAVIAILPTVGTAFVTVPAFVYLLLIGAYVEGALFAAYGLIVIGLVDNILGPRLIGHGKGVEIHPLLVLLAVLGGIGVFGAAGFLIGPMLLALLIALFHIYEKKVSLDEV